MFYGHIGGLHATARTLLNAEKMIPDGQAAQVLAAGVAPRPVSERQEYMENLLTAFIWGRY